MKVLKQGGSRHVGRTHVLQETDGVDVLLPAEALIALAVFCQCSKASNVGRFHAIRYDDYNIIFYYYY